MDDWRMETKAFQQLQPNNSRYFDDKLFRNNAFNITFTWRPWYSRLDSSPSWISFYLQFNDGIPSVDSFRITKMYIQARNTSCDVIYKQWAVGSQNLTQAGFCNIGMYNIIPIDFNSSNFNDGIVVIRYFWSLDSTTLVRTQAKMNTENVTLRL
jgi:hypothetical protein